MKTCNNCSTENHIAAEKCVQCHMPNDFTYQEMPTEAPQVVKVETIHCKNCATENPGTGEKCVQCNFPIQVKEQVTQMSQIPVKVNLKVS